MEERLRILLCEDDENLGMLLREYLQAKGFSADLLADGESGYKAFLKGKYDLCVLDVMMPKKDGFALAQEIRTVNSEVPIIFLTAKSLKEDILEGFKIGADDYITKPFSMEELVFRIEAIDDCCCTCRILYLDTTNNRYVGTSEFFTINLDCVGALRCLPDTFIDLC